MSNLNPSPAPSAEALAHNGFLGSALEVPDCSVTQKTTTPQ